MEVVGSWKEGVGMREETGGGMRVSVTCRGREESGGRR